MSTEHPQNIKISGAEQTATETPTQEVVIPQNEVAVVESTETQGTPAVVAENTETKTGGETPNAEVEGETDIKIKVTAEPTEEKVVTSEPSLLEKLGITEAELIEFKKFKEEKSQPDTESKAFADLTKYAIENKLATKDDIIQYENLAKADNKSVVYEKFADKYRKDNPNITLTDADIQEEFDLEYFIGNPDAKLAKQGERILAEEANEIRKPLVEKINSLKKDFVIGSNMAEFTKQQQTIVEEFNKHAIQKTVTINGKKITVEVEPGISFNDLKKHLSSTDEGKAQNNLLFDAFINDRTQSEQALGQLMSYMATSKTEVKILQAIADKAFEQGQESVKDKSPGAKAPFNSKTESVMAANPQLVDEAEQYRKFKQKRS